MKKVNWLITDNNITVNYDGQTHTVSRSDALADRLIQAVKENNLEEIPSLVSAAKRIEKYSDGKFLVKDGVVFVNGVEAPEYLSKKILQFSNDDLPVEPLVKFAENLQRNPSFRAVQELFQFLEKNDHPLTDNGFFIAYKKVKSDFKDAYTGTMDNSVGQLVKMPRNKVNEDPTQTCSYGLHVANWDYAHNVYSAGSNAIMLEVEVDPADVVAVPVDYNQAKMRVCAYKVLSVVSQPHEDAVVFRNTNLDEPLEKDDESCFHCASEYCEGECQDCCVSCFEPGCEGDCCCESCLETDCYGECEDVKYSHDPYPYDDEIC